MSSIIDVAAALKNALDSGTMEPTGTSAKRVQNIVNSYFKIKSELVDEIKPPKGLSMISAAPETYLAYGDEYYYYTDDIKAISDEIGILLSLWSSKNSQGTKLAPRPKRVFISHGQNKDWIDVQVYIEKTLELPTLELAQEANKGRTIFQKLIDESDNCGYAVVIMNGDDLTSDDQVRTRENVIHEIGYFQGKYGPDRFCLLHENGVNVPSNIHGVVYLAFPKGSIDTIFGKLTMELKFL